MTNKLQMLITQQALPGASGCMRPVPQKLATICAKLSTDSASAKAICYLCTLSVYKEQLFRLDPCNTYLSYKRTFLQQNTQYQQPAVLPDIALLKSLGKTLQLADSCLEQVYPDLLCLICIYLLEHSDDSVSV